MIDKLEIDLISKSLSFWDKLTEYEKKRMQAIYEADKRKEALYQEFPRLEEIDNLLSKEAIQTSRALITNPDRSLLQQIHKKVKGMKVWHFISIRWKAAEYLPGNTTRAARPPRRWAWR